MVQRATRHIVINGTFWPQPHTGSGQYVRNLLPHLVAQAPRDRYTLIVPRYLRLPHQHAQEVRTISLPTPFDRQSPRLAKLWFEQITMQQACRALRADLLHVPYLGAPVASAIPTVITVHDLIPLLLPAYRTSRALRWYMRLMQLSMQQAAALIAVSEFTRQEMQRVLGIASHKISVSYQSVADDYHPQPVDLIAAVHERWRIDAPYFYYIGGFDLRKNLATAINAFAKIRRSYAQRVQLVIAGELPTQQRALFPDIQRLIQDQGIGADVVLPGAISPAANAALMSGCTAFVFPSTYEGFGLPPLEAMRCGAPVLASATTSVGEVVNGGGLLLPPDDMHAWTNAMLRVLLDARLRAELRQHGLRRAQAFRWETTAQKTLEAYQQALQQ